MKIIFATIISVFLTFSVCGQKFATLTETETLLINAQELKELVKKPKEKQPILINFWATWCGPCRAEFPDLVEIDREYREKGLTTMLVSIDSPTLVNTLVSEFLQSYEAKMPSYLLNLPSRKAIAKAVRQIAPKFPDGYPFTILFDANGKLIYQKAGRINKKTLQNQIDKTLKIK